MRHLKEIITRKIKMIIYQIELKQNWKNRTSDAPKAYKLEEQCAGKK